MLLKKIYATKEKNWDTFQDKKLLSKNLYNKFLVRSSLLENKNFNIVDGDSSFFNFPSSKLKKSLFFNNNKLEGSSFVGENIIYTNKLNNSLKFKSFSGNIKTKNFSYINSFRNLIKSKKTKTENSLLILKPVKGGFICYSSGVVGFLPRSHAITSFLTIFFSLSGINEKRKLLERLNYSLSDKNFLKSNMGIRLPYNWGKAVLNSRFNKNSFIQGTRNKFSNRLNFIFLSKTPLKSNKNYKVGHEKNKNFLISLISK